MSLCMLERTTRQITATVTDENDAGIDVAALTTIVMTLYDKKTGSIINSRQDQDIKNANNVTIDSSGNLTWIVQPDDNIIVGSALPPTKLEHHVALIEWTWSGGSKEGRDTIDIFVRQMENVP